MAAMCERYPGQEDDEAVEQFIKVVSSLRSGQVQIIFQDSRVVQVDNTENVRLA
jgi:hypothetical protein